MSFLIGKQLDGGEEGAVQVSVKLLWLTAPVRPVNASHFSHF